MNYKFIGILFVCVLFSLHICNAEDKIYNKTLKLEVLENGAVADAWSFKYPESIDIKNFPDGKPFYGEMYVAKSVLKVLLSDPLNNGFGCYCAFSTLTDTSLVATSLEDLNNAPAIMLRPLEVSCFPSWMDYDTLSDSLYELQKATTERILTAAGYSVTNWKASDVRKLNDISVYEYIYSTTLNGSLDVVQNKVACFKQNMYTCELSMRSTPKDYKAWEEVFDRMVNSVELNQSLSYLKKSDTVEDTSLNETCNVLIDSSN